MRVVTPRVTEGGGSSGGVQGSGGVLPRVGSPRGCLLVGRFDRCGTRPGCGACSLERYLRLGNVRLHQRLRALGIRHIWDDYGPGTHDWPYWRRDLRETLPDLVRVLARA